VRPAAFIIVSGSMPLFVMSSLERGNEIAQYIRIGSMSVMAIYRQLTWEPRIPCRNFFDFAYFEAGTLVSNTLAIGGAQ
jgi:hypothetical protein